MAALTKVTIYTDGACSGNPGPGGWGAILSAAGKSREISGGEAHTTNNRMEMMAVIKSLELLTRPCEVEVYSDSAYVVNAFNQGWIEGWQKKGWKNSAKNEVANKDLWIKLIELCKLHTVRFIKVKGHADNEFNNRCDELAVMESKRYAKED
ncbi:MAG: ribonuclease HI [Clostridiales bacterium]|nr:ribonuclease HI [Clostridiales bacterium]